MKKRLLSKTCSIENCSRAYCAKGLCHNHYMASYMKAHRVLKPKQTCQREGCNNQTYREYCYKHQKRLLTLEERRALMRGKRNPRWSGGKTGYPNHAELKRNRIIRLSQNPYCELCGETASIVHHRNNDITNHALNNLMVLCKKCFYKKAWR